MAKRSSWGAVPENKGHQRLVRWVDTDTHSIAMLAKLVGVEPASAHAWYWRDSRPSEEMLVRLVAVLGGNRDEWFTDQERLKLRAERRAQQKRLKEMQKGAS